MPFTNRIRLPMQLHSAQFPEERTVFRKANGVTQTLSVTVRKTYELETDFLSEALHQRLKIALAHDNISWEGERYLGDIVQDGDYQIEWPDGVLHYPAAKASSKVQVTPFDATNSNCQTCAEASQLDLVDDQVTGLYGDPLEEDTDYAASLADNDVICCFPAVFSLTSFNTDYLTSATIDPATGELSIHTGTGLTDANQVLLATYRVTCPNGGYDEANVYGDIDGSIAAPCLAPESVEVSLIGATTATASWVESVAGSDYYWELYEGSVPAGSPVQSGSVTASYVDLTGLTAGMAYYFQVRTVCYGSESNYISDTFTTAATEQSCGEYKIDYFAPPSEPAIIVIGYIDCDALTQTVMIPNNSTRYVCALEDSPGDPVLLTSTNPYVTITYEGPC